MADKVLALWARARPRDCVDVAALLNRFGPRRLLELAAEKDSGFTIRTFTEALGAIARLTPQDWADEDVHPAAVVVVRRALDDWRERLLPASTDAPSRSSRRAAPSRGPEPPGLG